MISPKVFVLGTVHDRRTQALQSRFRPGLIQPERRERSVMSVVSGAGQDLLGHHEPVVRAIVKTGPTTCRRFDFGSGGLRPVTGKIVGGFTFTAADSRVRGVTGNSGLDHETILG